ncbi:hypothetical protein [Nonomuraea sp. NPDC050643]|uniref:hypothetical protein n=1 Tax=Nonomuraea sp. NPDC050643 TaxID=3155660 RepID=UPI0034031373
MDPLVSAAATAKVTTEDRPQPRTAAPALWRRVPPERVTATAYGRGRVFPAGHDQHSTEK